MADEVNAQVMDDATDWDELLSPFSDVVEDAESEKDSAVQRLAKNQRKLAEKQAKMESQVAREKLVNEFYAKATEEEKTFADVFLAGVSDPDKVAKMIDLAKAKAKSLSPEEPVAEAGEPEEDIGEVERALSAPIESAAQSPKDQSRARAERVQQGDMRAAFVEFMDLPFEGGLKK